MLDSEDFFAPPPGLPAGSGGEDCFADDPNRVTERRRGGGRQGRPRPSPVNGSNGIWLVTVAPGDEASSSSDAGRLPAGNVLRRVEGFAILDWTYKPAAGAEPNDAGVHVAGGGTGMRANFGRVDYDIIEAWRFAEPHMLPDDIDIDDAFAPRALEARFGQSLLEDACTTLSSFLSSSPHSFQKVIEMHKAEVDLLWGSDFPFIVSTVPLGSRVERRLLLAGEPSLATISKWRQAAACQNARGGAKTATAASTAGQTPAERAALDLPARWVRAENQRQASSTGISAADPLRQVNAVAFALHLRQVADFSEALDDARRYEMNDFDGEETRDASADPVKSNIMRATRRMDIVGMNVERRLWHAEVANDEVESIQCFSDSSPVTGTEIQGMLVDVIKKVAPRRRVILPCGSVFYGAQDSVAKTMVFVWAVWLVFGPDLKHMQFV